MKVWCALVEQDIRRRARNRYYWAAWLVNGAWIALPLWEREWDAAWTATFYVWAFVLLLAGAGAVDRDFRNGFALFVFTKPVGYWSYMVARLAGLVSVVATGVLANAVAISALRAVTSGQGIARDWILCGVVVAQLTIWALALIGLSALVPGPGNSVVFYGLLVLGALLSAEDLFSGRWSMVAVLGELLHPPNLIRLYHSGPSQLPLWAALLHAGVYPTLIFCAGGWAVSRRDLIAAPNLWAKRRAPAQQQ